MKIKKVLILALTLFMMCDMNNSIKAINSLNKSRINDFKVQLDDNELLMKSEIPDAIEYNNVIDKGHCKRVIEEEESLNSIVFKNTDGTHSRYIFNYPVKYIDEHGNVQDKSLEIKEDKKTNSYISDSSDISATFNKDLNSGVQLEYENIDLKMIPNFNISENSYVELSDDKKNISYSCHNNISLEYSLTYQGIKEDIILNKYSGINKFSFTLLTNGLKLDIDEDKNYNLYDSNGLIRANIGEIVIYDSANNMCIGSLVSKTIKENTEYLLEISVDETFLTDSETVFPVYIDPTIEIDYEHYGSNLYDGEPAISYSTIYSDGSSNSNGVMTVGKYNSKVSRVLMRFPALFTSTYGFYKMDKNQVNSVNVYLKDVGYQSDINAMDVTCYEYKNHWPDCWEKWDMYDDNLEPLYSNNICHSSGIEQTPIHTYAFNITSLAKKWNFSMGSHYWKYGIMFKADDAVENGNKSLYSSFGSYNSVYYAPYLVIDYNTIYDYEFAQDAPLSYTYKSSLYLEAGKEYIFQTEKATDYFNCDTELYLFKSDITDCVNDGDYSWFNDDISSINKYSKIEVSIPVSGSYILMVKCYDSVGKNGVCTSGYCNIYKIDPKTQSKTLLKENAKLGGYRIALPENMYINNYINYNSFTVTNNIDTVMYVLSEDETKNKKVIGYNDDYNGGGTYNWYRASRIKQKYSRDNKPRYIFVTSFSPTITGNVDIYGMCKDSYSNVSMFPNLNEDDSIISASKTTAYNCISYSGGITSEWINPNFTLVGGYLTPWYNKDNQVAFDNFYGNNPPRYIGATTYSVTDNETDAVINVYKNGDTWTHASVRKPANNQMHGYAWESKLGAAERIFHTLHSLDNDENASGYGHIERRYKIKDKFTLKSDSYSKMNLNDITFEKSVKEGLTAIQNIEINDKEIYLLENIIQDINSNEISEFNRLYFDWINKILDDNVLSVLSDSSYYLNIPEYKKLSDFIDSNEKIIYLVINKYINEDTADVFLTTLFNDKVVKKNTSTLELANDIRIKNNEISMKSLDDDIYIAPTYKTNVICFIKAILSDSNLLF